MVVYRLQNVSGKSGWKVNGTRLILVPQKNSGINETSEKVVRLFQVEFGSGQWYEKFRTGKFRPGIITICTNLRLIRSMTAMFFADSNRFRTKRLGASNSNGSVNPKRALRQPQPLPLPRYLQLSVFQNKTTNLDQQRFLKT